MTRLTKAAGDEDASIVRRTSRKLDDLLRALAASASSEAALNALGSGNATAFLGKLDWESLSYGLGDLQDNLAAESLIHSYDALGAVGPAQANLLFNTVEQRAVNYGAQRAGILIREVTEQVRTTVNGLVVESLNGKYTVGQLRSIIAEVVPLNSRSAQAVENTFTRSFERLIREGKTASQTEILATRAAERQAARLRTVRADAIARTELLTAANSGRYEGWATTIGSGLDSTLSKKEWITGGNPCPECDPMDGEIVLWDEEFSGGVVMPPLHVSCRCTATLLPASIEPREGFGRRRDEDAYGTAATSARSDEIQKARAQRLADGSIAVPNLSYDQALTIVRSARAFAQSRISEQQHRIAVDAILNLPKEKAA